VSPLLPAAAFIPLRINAPVRVRFRSGRSPLLDAAFCSPAATADLSIRLRGRVNAPGLHLRSDSKISAQPVRLRTPALALAFCRPARHVHRTQPVAKSDFRTPCLSSGLRSPPGSLDPSGSKRWCAPALPIPVEAHSSMRPFALRRRRLALRPVPAAGSTLPACTFKAILKSPSDPFGSALLPPSSFFSPRGVHSSYETRCQIRSQNSLSVPKSPLPFRTSRSLQLVAPNLVSNREACPCESPDFPSLPAAPK